MSDVINLKANARNNFGKGVARKLRVAGEIPAVVYGNGKEPVHVSVPAHDMLIITRKRNALLNLEINGDSVLVLLKSVQRDPVKQIIEHIDFVNIAPGQKVEVGVPVRKVGTPFSGSVVMTETPVVKVSCEVMSIPEFVDLDVTGLTGGQSRHAKDVVLPEGLELTDNPYTLLINVISLRGAKTAATAE